MMDIFKQDRHWRSALHIFMNQPKLQKFCNTHIDTEELSIREEDLQKISTGWSRSEKFMLSLALHLFRDQNQINLSDMDYLDKRNKAIAIEAIKMRFN